MEGDQKILEDSNDRPAVSGLFFHLEEAATIEIPSDLSRISGLHRTSVPQSQRARCDLEAATAQNP